MPINLKDIPDAVQAYLNTKVTATITEITPASGTTINPGETFTVAIKSTNADLATGVNLKNVKYRVKVDNPVIAKFVVPPAASGTAKDLAGNTLAPGTEVGEMIFDPANVAFELPAGDIDTIVFTGKAGSGAGGGTTPIRARLIADVDVDSLFPKGEDTLVAAKTLQVVG